MRPSAPPGRLPVTPSKKRLPAAAFSNTKVEVRKIGGFSEPSLSSGSNPYPSIRLCAVSLRLPILVGDGRGWRLWDTAPLSSFSVGKEGLLIARCARPRPPAGQDEVQGRAIRLTCRP